MQVNNILSGGGARGEQGGEDAQLRDWHRAGAARARAGRDDQQGRRGARVQAQHPQRDQGRRGGAGQGGEKVPGGNKCFK